MNGIETLALLACITGTAAVAFLLLIIGGLAASHVAHRHKVRGWHRAVRRPQPAVVVQAQDRRDLVPSIPHARSAGAIDPRAACIATAAQLRQLALTAQSELARDDLLRLAECYERFARRSIVLPSIVLFRPSWRRHRASSAVPLEAGRHGQLNPAV